MRAAAALPGAIVYVPPPPALAMVAAGLALVLLPWIRGRSATLGVAALALGAGALTIAAARPDGLVRIVVLDVGQGEAILVQAPTARRSSSTRVAAARGAATGASAWSSPLSGGWASGA